MGIAGWSSLVALDFVAIDTIEWLARPFQGAVESITLLRLWSHM